MVMTPIYGYLFDLDGVLLAEAPELHYQALCAAMKEYDHQPIPAEIHALEYNGMGTKEKMLKWFGAEEDDKDDWETLNLINRINKAKQRHTEILIKERVRPSYEVSFFVKHLAATNPLAVVTNCLRQTTMLILDQMELTSYFKAIITASDVTKKKPDSQPYLYGAAALNLNPVNCLAIDDSPLGCTSAIAAGCPTWHLKHPSSLRLSRLWTVIKELENNKVVKL